MMRQLTFHESVNVKTWGRLIFGRSTHRSFLEAVVNSHVAIYKKVCKFASLNLDADIAVNEAKKSERT